MREVAIDFSEAQRAWRGNKAAEELRGQRTGQFRYICVAQTEAGNGCKRRAVVGGAFGGVMVVRW